MPTSPAVIAEKPESAPGFSGLFSSAAILTRAALVFAALLVFILALKLLQGGAGGLKPLLSALSVDSPASSLGFGWLGAYIVLSGSPVAAISTALYGGGELNQAESYAMLVGSRFGASMVVLVVGVLAFFRGRERNTDGIYIGVTALVTTFTQYLPALFLGFFLLDSGVIGDREIIGTSQVDSVLDVTYGPLVDEFKSLVPDLALFVLGVPLLLVAFQAFDRALPALQEGSLQRDRVTSLLHSPLAMFVLGFAVTAVTLSVALSLTLLVPLAMKGYVRKERVIPYVLGANISTWVDTLLAALLVARPGAPEIVLTAMVAGSLVSLALLLAYPAYAQLVRRLTELAMQGPGSLLGFVVVITVVPAVLLFAA
jgi:solute carrier family 34 (sodium-dependent phosphate cotransporter)